MKAQREQIKQQAEPVVQTETPIIEKAVAEIPELQPVVEEPEAPEVSEPEKRPAGRRFRK
jgi:hypothetical protein